MGNLQSTNSLLDPSLLDLAVTLCKLLLGAAAATDSVLSGEKGDERVGDFLSFSTLHISR